MKSIKKSIYFMLLFTSLHSVTATASDGTISFSGGIVASTCIIKLNDVSASGTVTMPWVALNLLATTGNIAAPTNFTLNLSGCTTVTGATLVNAFFESGAGVNNSTGNLINTGTATNVAVQLLVAGTMTQIIPGLATQAQPASVSIPGGTGTLAYVAQYISTGVATAGTIISSVTYSLTYQ